MKTRHIIIKSTVLWFLTSILLFSGCKKDDNTADSSVRLFRPTLTGDGVYVSLNTIYANWQKVKGAVNYTAQISRDTFKTIDQSFTLDSASVAFENLKWKTGYMVRVRANNIDTLLSSRMANFTPKSLVTDKFPTILVNPAASDVTDKAVKVSWTSSGDAVTSIVVATVPSANDTIKLFEVTLTAQDVAAQFKIIDGLSPETKYTCLLYSGWKLRGWNDYTTKSTPSGIQIDLTTVTYRANILFDTLASVPSGSTILLKRGLNYYIPSTYTFTKSVSIQSAIEFGTNLATVTLTGNFDISGSIDYLKFTDLIIARTTAVYFMNASVVGANVGLLSFENCQTLGIYANSFVRLKADNQTISKLYVNNCIIDSIGVGASYPVFYAASNSSAKIDNIEIHNSTFNSIFSFIRQDGVSATSILVDQCTFNDMLQKSGYFINCSVFPTTVNVTNCILGKVTDATAAKGLNPSTAVVGWSGSYMTSDCKFSGNAITGPTAYAKASTALFTNPAIGDFSFLDLTFIGKLTAGDPRWRK